MDRLILVNRDNPVPEGFNASIELASVEVDEAFSVPLEQETADSFRQLRQRLLSVGIHVEVVSGYRHQETQERIWNESVSAHGEAHTRQYVAAPGHSEHQTGLALDFTLYDDQGEIVDDDDLEAYEKLFPYFHEYGFILRYPAGKEDMTGFQHEPWHIRYVGKKAASEIYENGLTLEEYATRMRAKPE